MEIDKNLFRLTHISECIEKIEMLTLRLHNYDNFENNWIERDAMIRNFEIIGEAAKNISDSTIQNHPEIEWFK